MAANDNFGTLVALSDDGTVLVVGASYNNGARSDAGHVRVHARDAITTAWTQL